MKDGGRTAAAESIVEASALVLERDGRKSAGRRLPGQAAYGVTTAPSEGDRRQGLALLAYGIAALFRN